MSPCSSVRDLGMHLQANLKPSVPCTESISKASAHSKPYCQVIFVTLCYDHDTCFHCLC